MFIEHVNLTVSDLDRSIGFYRTLLGLDVRWRGTTSTGTAAAHVGNEKWYVAMFEADRPGVSVDDYSQVGLNHFGIVVEDLDEVRRRVESMGFEVHGEADYEPGRRFYLHDPDGIEVEIVQYDKAKVSA